MSSEQGFPDYITQTNESGAALYTFVLVYTLLSFLLIAPLVIWGRKQAHQDDFLREEEVVGSENRTPQGLEPIGLGQQPVRLENPLNSTHPATNRTEPTNASGRPRRLEVQSERGAAASGLVSEGEAHSEPVQRINRVQRAQGSVLRQLDRYAASSYPDENVDFVMSAISGGTARSRAQDSVGRDQSSSTPSAATTSRLYRRATQQQPRTKVWDVHGKRWKGRRPVGRADTIQRAIETETQVMVSSAAARSQANRCSAASGRVTPPVYRDPSRIVSTRGNGAFGGGQMPRPRMRSHRRRGGSFSSAESGSILPFVEDDITPNDAADAGDPGQQILFDVDERREVTVFCGPNALWKPSTLVNVIDDMADIANPDQEMKRILGLSFPLTLGAVSDSVFQAVIVAVVSHSIGTDSMAAFVLVSLFLGLSDDFVGAIADAESALCSHAMNMGDMYLTGQYVQLAMCFHLIVSAGIMAIWLLYMDPLVQWLVDSPNIAEIALSYTKIAVFQHLLQTLSRTVTVLFHLVGSENFETQVDFGEGLVTLLLVASFLPVFREVTLDSVGWIQLTTAIAAFALKALHAITRGWPSLFWRGLAKDWAFRNVKAAKQLVASSMPLFVGAFLEYGEWELLVIFVANLGTAEVVAWILLGIIWKVLESSSEGIGEAAAIRVAYHLGTGNPKKARLSSYKSCFVSMVQSLLVTSTLFMIGKNVATWLTTDVTLQNMVNAVIPLVGVGNIVMNFALICWNLIGAQGRYRLATSVILLSRWLVTVPIAAVFSYALTLDLSGMMAAVIVGFDTACMALAYVLLRSDWGRLSRTMQDIGAIIGDDDSEDVASDEEVGGVELVDEELHAGTKQDE